MGILYDFVCGIGDTTHRPTIYPPSSCDYRKNTKHIRLFVTLQYINKKNLAFTENRGWKTSENKYLKISENKVFFRVKLYT